MHLSTGVSNHSTADDCHAVPGTEPEPVKSALPGSTAFGHVLTVCIVVMKLSATVALTISGPFHGSVYSGTETETCLLFSCLLLPPHLCIH